MALTLTSDAFSHEGQIPALHTCEGKDTSPPLGWSGAPAITKSFALIVDDPDAPDPRAPKMTWVHWVLYNLPATTTSLPAAVDAAGLLPPGTHELITDFQRRTWGGPCPPIGRHRYVFKLYALDVVLPDLGAGGKRELELAMEGHVLAKTELVGTYQKAHKR